jgi:hypothetical protein
MVEAAAKVAPGPNGGPVIDVKEVEKRINNFISLTGEEQFNLIVGGTLLSAEVFD